MEALLRHISEQQNIRVETVRRLTGGDINSVYLLTTNLDRVVLKINDAETFPNMFKAEAQGLNLLRTANAFEIPEIVSYGKFDTKTYLLLEYVPPGEKDSTFWNRFAGNLATLHRTTQAHFGLDHDNYIGSLRQYNSPERTAADFYLNQRLIPQFRMAAQRGFTFTALERFYKNLFDIIPTEVPSLIHGDLWGGNYIVSERGSPTLIDPAVAFAPREMDLAMMHLFGGFDPVVFNHYDEIFRLEANWKERQPLWQLYYLLVHLNLFGRSYHGRVQEAISKYA